MVQKDPRFLNLAGLFLILGCSQFLIFLIVASSLYPGYSISQNYISDLGATCRAHSCVVFQPSSTIFTISVILLGIMAILSSVMFRRGGGDPYLSIFLFITGIGSIGVGIFDETFGALHTLFAAITFIFGAAAPIASYRILKGYTRIIAPTMGFLAIVFLVLFITRIDLGLGPGGVERLVAYFELIPGIIIGSYLATPQR